MALTKTPIELSSTPSIVDGGNATAITIDSSENVLVGTTATDTAAVGFRYRSSLDAISSVADGGISAYFGRRTSDGDIVAFRKNDDIVGSIGTTASNLVIGTGSVGLRFYDGGDAVLPHTAAGGSSNGLVDLGQGGFNAFKDLYLSGGVYLGGTAAANKLEDYEEGTWTPVIAGCTISIGRANYVKIGGLVKLDFNVVITGNDNSGSPMLMTGVPFTASSANSESVGSPMLRYFDFDSGATDVVMYHYSRTPTIEFYEVSDDSNWSLLRRDQITSNSAAIIGTITITVD